MKKGDRAVSPLMKGNALFGERLGSRITATEYKTAEKDDWFDKLWSKVFERRAERIRKAGKHECEAVRAGEVARVTGRGGRILKRAVVVLRFYECGVCGREMAGEGRSVRDESVIEG